MTLDRVGICLKNKDIDNDSLIIALDQIRKVNPGTSEIILSGNKITKISKEMFLGFRNLWHLNLSSNRILEIEQDSFKDFRNLEKLYLHENKLQKFPMIPFQDVQILRY